MYASDYKGGINLLQTAVEKALYFEICLHIWDKGEPIHESDLWRMMREPKEEIQQAYELLLRLDKVQRDEAGYVSNARALREYHEAQARHKANTERSTKGADARWHKTSQSTADKTLPDKQCLSNAQAMPNQCQPEPEPDNTPRRKKPPSRGSGNVKVALVESKSGPVWDAYAKAYEQVYDVPPTRNGKVNGILCRFVERVGADDAPGVAAFYVGHPSKFYRSRGHPVELLLQDAEKLRTEWLRNKPIPPDLGGRPYGARGTNMDAAEEAIRRRRERKAQREAT